MLGRRSPRRVFGFDFPNDSLVTFSARFPAERQRPGTLFTSDAIPDPPAEGRLEIVKLGSIPRVVIAEGFGFGFYVKIWNQSLTRKRGAVFP
jgi:hypothetical protein